MVDLLNVVVKWRDKHLNVDVNQISNVQEFGSKLQKLTNVKPDTLRLLVPRLRNKGLKMISPFSEEHSSLSLLESSILKLVAIPRQFELGTYVRNFLGRMVNGQSGLVQKRARVYLRYSPIEKTNSKNRRNLSLFGPSSYVHSGADLSTVAMEVLKSISFYEDVVPDGTGRKETYLVLKKDDPGLLWLAKSSLEISMV